MTRPAAPRQVLSAAQMRAEEQRLIAAGISENALMDRAGQGAADWVFRLAARRPVSVLCGPGNNGGDGYAIARELAARGVPVVAIAPLAPATPAAQAARHRYEGKVVDRADGIGASVLVDCLFGTGLARPLSGRWLALLRTLAMRHELRIAIDLPSGAASDTGALLNDGLPEYHLTLALGAWKPSHWLYPAASRMGQRRLVDIGCGAVAGAGECLPRIRIRPPAGHAHKYSRGLLAVVAGEMPGASLLAARAALHGGAGYVRLLRDRQSARAIGEPWATPHELVVEHGPLARSLADPRLSAILLGPGLGRDAAARALPAAALAAGKPLVLDADALRLLAPAELARASAPLVLTPHEGELAHLFGILGLEAGDRLAALAALSGATGAVVVAKGPATLVQAPGAPPVYMPPASSWLSTAGTGDVLAGLVASRLATGASPRAAAIEACAIHACAARIAGPAFSAGTLIAALPAAMAELA